MGVLDGRKDGRAYEEGGDAPMLRPLSRFPQVPGVFWDASAAIGHQSSIARTPMGIESGEGLSTSLILRRSCFLSTYRFALSLYLPFSTK
jgi:hypothetical protein